MDKVDLARVGGTGNSGSSRMSAKAAIDHRIERLRREADQLEQLSAICDDRLPQAAEEALWQLLMNQR